MFSLILVPKLIKGIFSFLNPGDTILGMSLDAGGHLTHGAKPNLSGKWFNSIQYGLNKDDSLINFDQIDHYVKFISQN